MAVCQLPVLPPPERHHGHGVHHYEDGADEEVEEQDYAGQYLQDKDEVLLFRVPDEKIITLLYLLHELWLKEVINTN